jgi:hypothetical protein
MKMHHENIDSAPNVQVAGINLVIMSWNDIQSMVVNACTRRNGFPTITYMLFIQETTTDMEDESIEIV